MARMTNKKRAEINKQLWDKANSSHRQRWQVLSQKGYDFYLNEQLTKDEQKEFLGVANSETDRLTRLVNDVLDLSKLESGRNVKLESIDSLNSA